MVSRFHGIVTDSCPSLLDITLYKRYNHRLTPFALFFSAHLSPELRRTCPTDNLAIEHL